MRVTSCVSPGADACLKRPGQLLNVRLLDHAVVLAGDEMDVDLRRQAAPAPVAAGRDRERGASDGRIRVIRPG